MLISAAPTFARMPNPHDADFYVRYVEICRRAGVEPNSPQRVREMVSKWNQMLTGATFNPSAEHPGGCYTWRYFGGRLNGDTVRCAKPGNEHVRSQAMLGCAFWQREPGADDN